ncbi:MAG: ComFC [Candidatus Saganbacteria bacterium]|uniref:ComFC n=1 Tax=Candidatus Saganbacteria bacterium TaxID=2575572 RepID=A0A833NX17_UNCSA|nr:MAG: ComFC [Candidatus Saganbacteria bacterium]
MQFLKSILDLVFPPRCEVCLSPNDKVICGGCAQKISFLKPSAFIHSVGEYDGVLKTAILKFKFKNKTGLAEPLGAFMVKYLSQNLDMNKVDFIVPVPLHSKKFLERGFNQSELLSHAISKHYNLPTVSGLLFRVKETNPQFELPRNERIKNVKGAFEVRGANLLRDRNILLVDDIYTTGSTVSECTKILKTNGAKNVHVLTLSRAYSI